MKENIKQLSAEEQLLQSRELGLQEALKVNAMSAHGKILGMDTFSWINPNNDVLATVISSFPFPVLWIGNHNQIKSVIEGYPNVVENISTIIVQDRSTINIDRKLLSEITNIMCVEGSQFAIEAVRSLSKDKHAFLFTCDGNEATGQKRVFTDFISQI